MELLEWSWTQLAARAAGQSPSVKTKLEDLTGLVGNPRKENCTPGAAESLLRVNCTSNDDIFCVLEIVKVIGTHYLQQNKALYRASSPGLVMDRFSPAAASLVSDVLKQILLKIPFL